jgi:hypothetical protein
VEVWRENEDGRHQETTLPLSGQIHVCDVRDRLGPLWDERDGVALPALRPFWSTIGHMNAPEARLLLQGRLDAVGRRVAVPGVTLQGHALAAVGALAVVLLMFGLLARLRQSGLSVSGESKGGGASTAWFQHRHASVRWPATALATVVPVLAVAAPALRTRDLITLGRLGALALCSLGLAFCVWRALREPSAAGSQSQSQPQAQRRAA